MDKLIPSTGEMRPGSYINFNVRGYKAGDRALFERVFGRPCIGTIFLMDGNIACFDLAEVIDPLRGDGTPPEGTARIFVTNVKAKLRSAAGDVSEAALLTALGAAFAAAPSWYEAERQRLVRAHNRTAKAAGGGR
jgi:hypothetical protein